MITALTILACMVGAFGLYWEYLHSTGPVYEGSTYNGNTYEDDTAVLLEPHSANASTSMGVSTSTSLKYPRLLIPGISVDAFIQEVGYTKTGDMGIPTNFKDVGWYKHGPRPGEVGSAVVAGHVDNALGLPAVFKKLHTMGAGDSVYVIAEDGEKLHYKVISIDSYRYDEAPTEVIFGPSDKTLLRLITCGGKWIRSEKTYDTRIVVTAELQ